MNPSNGIHDTTKFVTENGYRWSDCYGDPNLLFRRGYNSPNPSKGYGKLMNMFCSLTGIGNIIASWIVNDVERALGNIKQFQNTEYADGTINVVMVDYYDVGDESIMKVQNVMRNADANGLVEGQSCIGYGVESDGQCAGSFQCGKRSLKDEHENDYICCDGTYAPTGGKSNVCGEKLGEGGLCPSTSDEDCTGSLRCKKRSESDDIYICCRDTFWTDLWAGVSSCNASRTNVYK